jgi:purine-nucleoside phosphorylase|uniref:Purine nucleoside phosphorylase n=1 Tax=Desulfobacca acetoxidans TaxID=60893 RepID=A0A7C3SKG9_9BACT
MVIYTARGKYRQEIEECARFLWDKLPFRPQWGIITGTGQTQLAKRLESPRGGVPYQELPHFPQPTGPGHEGWLHWGSLAGKPVLLFQGRIHAYEGYSLPEVTFPVRVMAALGVKQMLVTNAAGGLNPHFQAGDLMLISDHINLIGDNPLVGENIDDWGPRFPDMSRAYDRELLELAEEVGRQQGLGLRKGVYVAVKGPSLETPAETRFLRLIGADAVGMSTVPEVIVGVHAGFRIMGISVISNVNLPEAMAPIALEQIIATVAAAEPRLVEFISGVLERT